jgi:hypothetical protein
MTASLLEEIAEARSPLAAERVLCGAFAAVEASLPDDADEEERLEALTLLLDQVIGYAQALGTADALALLRVCSVLGPATSQAAAGEGAGQLAAAGVADRAGSAIRRCCERGGTGTCSGPSPQSVCYSTTEAARMP